MSNHPIAQPRPVALDAIRLKTPALAVLLAALLAVTGCHTTPAPAAEMAAPPVTSTMVTAPVRAPSPTIPRPTATFVPLVTPSPTPEGGAPSKVRVPRISVGTAREMADAGEAVLVDVRTKGTFEAGHIAGAMSLPSKEIPDRYGELPADKLVIFYCA